MLIGRIGGEQRGEGKCVERVKEKRESKGAIETDDTPVGFVERTFFGKKELCYIKRVIGLPGETVQIVGSDIFINGRKLEEDYGKIVLKFN